MARFKGAILECAECGKEFRVPPVRMFTAKYCSTTCADAHRNDRRKKEKAKKVCPQCGKTFWVFPSHSERRIYCSYECKDRSASLGVPVDSHFYNRTFWRNLRQKILNRDSYRCSVCGMEEGRLHVHHIVGRVFGGLDTENNLTSLCGRCHRLVHYGRICCASVN
jgi:uncharacterized protein with PIN domain